MNSKISEIAMNKYVDVWKFINLGNQIFVMANFCKGNILMFVIFCLIENLKYKGNNFRKYESTKRIIISYKFLNNHPKKHFFIVTFP